MSRTKKPGKRGFRYVILDSHNESEATMRAIQNAQSWGWRWRGKRRHRQLWSRLAAKGRRARDKEVILAGEMETREGKEGQP